MLHMRDLDAARPKREREIDHLDDPIDVRTMRDRIHREGGACVHDLGREPLAGKLPS
jgi:hypothetical protein